MALYSAERVYRTREIVAEYLGFDKPENVIFTHNATHAINLAIKGFIDHKCHVIISDMEHNAVVRSLNKAAEDNSVEISVFDSALPLEEVVPPLIRDNTEFLVCSLISNVTGQLIDPEDVSRVSKKYGLFSIIDASQYLGHYKLDINRLGFSAVCAPGHKALFGIQGSGILVINTDREAGTIIEGGSGGDSLSPWMPRLLPERLEAGTVNLPAIAALGAGIGFLEDLGSEYVRERINLLTEKLHEILYEDGAIVYGCDRGIASFGIIGMTPSEACRYLDENGIATRCGLHCAPSIHRKLGTQKYGTARISLSIFNTEYELDKLHSLLKSIKEKHRQ